MRTPLLRWLLSAVVLFLAVEANAQCDPALNPLDDGSGAFGAVGLPQVVISEIKPGAGGYVEYFNTTAAAVNLAPLWLCSPFDYAPAGAIMVPAHGYATVPWPVIFSDTPAGGEVILFKSAAFGTSTEILDYVCWGTNPHSSRQAQAIAVGKWSGACPGVLTNGAIHRKIGTKGTTAADYDVTKNPSPMNCVPSTTNVSGTPPYPAIRLSVGPNPFSALATFEFSLSSPASVDMTIYSVTGARVRRLETGLYPAGTARVLWDGRDASGRSVPSGTYLVKLSANAASVTTRVTIVH